MGQLYDFLGQKIALGGVVGDICTYNTRLNYTTSPTYFDPIKYAKGHGGVPTSDHTYYFTSSLTGDDDPVFGIYFRYTGGVFRVGYCMRYYDNNSGTWAPFLDSPNFYNWPDSYAGADPDNLTEDDGWHNGLWLYEISVATSGNYDDSTGGYCLGHDDWAHGTPEPYPGTSPYHLDTGQTPERYVYDDINYTYGMFDYAGYQITWPGFGLQWSLELMQEIDGSEDDDSVPEGGGGNYSFPTEDVGFGSLPNLNIIDTGIATMWTPEPAELQGLVNFLWSPSFENTVLKLCDPIDNIIQLGIVPVNLSDYKGAQKECKVGNVSTGVTMTPLTDQYIEYDCGKISIPEEYGSCLDYAPNTKISCYAPYVGVFDLNPDEVMKAEYLHMKYKIDLLTGDFVMQLLINKKMPAPMNKFLNSVLYHKPGNLMTKIPITGANYSKMYSQILQGVANGVTSAMSGNIGGVAEAVAGIATSAYNFDTQRSGQFTGSSAILSNEYPHLIITQPKQVKPARYGEFEGYTTHITYKLNDITLSNKSVYVKVEEFIDNKVVGATETEQKEIERLLKEGVYL